MSSRSTQLAVRALAAASALPRPTPLLRCSKCATRHPPPSPLSRRHLSTSSPSSGVTKWLSSRRTSPSSPSNAHENFLQAIKSNSVSALRDAYDILHTQRVQSLSNPSSQPNQQLQPGEIMQAMIFLSMRSEPTALAFLKRIYADLPRWAIEPQQKHFRTVLRGLCSVGHIAEAISWATEGNGTVDDWRLVLRGAIRHDMSQVPAVEERLREQTLIEGKKLSAADFILLLRHLRFDQSDEKETMRRLRQLLAEAKANGEWIQVKGEVELVGIHLRLGEVGRAGNIVEKWNLGNDPELWNTMLDWRIARNEGKGVEDALSRMKESGLAPYAKAVGHLALRHVSKNPTDIVNSIDDIERKYGAKISSATWAEILTSIPQIEDRLALYEQIRSSGVMIDTHIAKSLIFPLCELEPPNLRAALDVYADLTSRSMSISTFTVRGRILAIYSTLFRAYSVLSPGADEKIPITLLKDMRRFGLALPTPALTSLIISLIRASPDHYTAFNNYAHLYALDPSLITSKSYTAIINAFIAHSTPTSHFAPPTYIIEMLKDMRKAGYPPSPEILTTLLSNYSQQARISRKTSTDPIYRQTKLDGIHKAITEIHNMLKLESLVTPDIPLYNALMDAYARLGAYSAAFEVWDILVERRPHVDKKIVKEAYGPSISIILDACGRAGQLARARRIWAWAKRCHLVDGDGKGKAWEGWVECLCRLGQVEEASEVVLRDANLEMIRILGKFSWRQDGDGGLYRQLPGKLREKYPEWWELVKSEREERKKRRGPVGLEVEVEDDEGKEGVSL